MSAVEDPPPRTAENTGPASQEVTRLAPSPTGALHLGNARTFLLNHLLAVSRGWRVLMRMEDLDGPRVKPGAAGGTLDDLAWLGLRWDGPVLHQSAGAGEYRSALAKLISAGATPERLLGLLDFWSGLVDRRRPASMDELLERFDADRIPRSQVVFAKADDEFLLGR